jgi:hypothetical protein
MSAANLKPLPVRSSLEQYKRQAKGLIKAFRRWPRFWPPQAQWWTRRGLRIAASIRNCVATPACARRFGLCRAAQKMIFYQAEFDIRCEWGLNGIQQLAGISDAIVIIDPRTARNGETLR